MKTVTVEIPVELQKVLDQHKQVGLAEIASKAILTEAKKIQLTERLVANSKLTEKDVEELDHIIKKGIAKHYKKYE